MPTSLASPPVPRCRPPFKRTDTGETKRYAVNLNHTLYDFLKEISRLIERDFGLTSFQIVEADKTERGEPILPDKNRCLSNILEKEDYCAFYIRPTVCQSSPSPSLQECPICYDSFVNLSRPYDCQHGICSGCFRSWQAVCAVSNCPICRCILPGDTDRSNDWHFRGVFAMGAEMGLRG